MEWLWDVAKVSALWLLLSTSVALLIGRFMSVQNRHYWRELHRETQDIPERPDVGARKAS